MVTAGGGPPGSPEVSSDHTSAPTRRPGPRHEAAEARCPSLCLSPGPALAGRPKHTQPQPHGQLPAVPELRHRGRPAPAREPAQQPLGRTLRHPTGADLPAAGDSSVHCGECREAAAPDPRATAGCPQSTLPQMLPQPRHRNRCLGQGRRGQRDEAIPPRSVWAAAALRLTRGLLFVPPRPVVEGSRQQLVARVFLLTCGGSGLGGRPLLG